MTQIYRCQLELHDSLYFATREIGRLYETEPILHNYALCYALGFVDNPRYQTQVNPEEEYRYFCRHQVPQYQAHLTKLNEQKIYVTPARSLRHTAVLNTWKYADNRYHVEMQKTQKNIPSFGRAKEIAPESQFEFFVISEQAIQFPQWIRLGKWMSKAKLDVNTLENVQRHSNQTFTVSYPLNPLDVMFGHEVIQFDTINMPPVSLIRNVKLRGDSYRMSLRDGTVYLPANMTYQFQP
ncbi:type I-D CRISPR-associated protein Cas5/Csc1 [Geitlerinema sp. P-1104]|uniref:type I-D CRISPR-associated protein Cas5/Csc1 n=1 Tax=Geitlerinema sp. P-1104 TaxID=2546230 RepID=UPI00147762F3|nr:type I-D CRISPR-associated protein Cas5/Csc1 [Geitlerinema sp. P-1104]NMG60328.1 type I-D CRISPR-associated protein Cas5/Csc1 [Geitlerinema sp. P-1104]